MRGYFRFLLFPVLAMLAGAAAHAQTETPWEQYVAEMGELEDVESAAWESSHEQLAELAEHPIDLNAATREDLLQIPFLTEQEIEGIAEYVYRHGPLESIGELGMIRELSPEKRRLLQGFVYIGRKRERGFPAWKDILRYGQNTLLASGKVPFYEREGDKNGYRGYPYKHSLRYTFSYGNYLKAGVVGAQDAGEPFLANKNGMGYDFYSFYAVAHHWGRFKTLAVGRYRVGFGAGLVVNNNFSPGKIGMLVSLGRSQDGIRAHASTMQANYLQGVAATVGLTRHVDFSAFVSYRKIDATLNDSNQIQTIRTDGYHRTNAELAHKDNAAQTVGGGHISVRNRGFHAGATATFTHLDHRLQPNTTAVYRQPYAHGNDIWNASLDYGYTGHRLTFSGETATGSCGALATLNTLSLKASDELSLMALQRFYSYRYYSLFSQAFSENGTVQDESGLCLGGTWQPSRRFSLMAYTDYSYFAWPKYQASQASHAWDNLMQMNYRKGPWLVSLRYRLKRRERDGREKNQLEWKTEHRGRLALTYERGAWSSRTQGDLSYVSFLENSLGWMVSEQVQFRKRWLQASASVAYFHTDDYDARVYAYERGLLYSFNFPAFYGKGIRYWLQARAEIARNVLLIAKLATTDYFDRSSIGSGLQRIGSSAMTDLELQVKWKF